MCKWLGLVALATVLSFPVHASTSPALPAPVAPRLVLPERNHAALLAEDAAKPRNAPLRYAVAEPVAVSAQAADAGAGGAKALPAGGEWSTLADGRARWRLDVQAPGALGLEFSFRRMFLPQGSELRFRSPDGKSVQGPYTDADNTRWGGFRSGWVPGEEGIVELIVSSEMKRHVVLELDSVSHGYRDIFSQSSLSAKSLSCEIDVACPDGDGFRDPIRAVARYTFQAGSSLFLCTGQLLNDTIQDRKRYFHTAEHCVSTQSEASSMVLYWNYQSPVCRAAGSQANGSPLSTNIAVVQTGGATLRAHFGGSDVSLVELNAAIPAQANVWFDGWDRRDVVPASTAVVHHANGDEKRISLDLDPPLVPDFPIEIPGAGNEPSINIEAGAGYVVTYDRGTTEGGSSGAGLLSPQGRVIGQLAGGSDSMQCTVAVTDEFGRFERSWEGGGSAATRVKDWLDPASSGAELIEGSNNCAAPQVSLTAPGSAQAGTAITLSANPVGAGPFTINWDVDGDGVTDRSVSGVTGSTSIPVNFPSEDNVVVRVRAVDATGCGGEAAKAVVVTGPSIGTTLAGQPTQLCGNGDAVIDPGERWNVPVFVFNSLAGSTLNGAQAIFSRPYQGTALTVAGPDTFGYVAADDGSGCNYQFVDLEGQTATLPLTPAPGLEVDDDAHSGVLNFSQSFGFYGTAYNSVVMSTNGYLSSSPNEQGADVQDSCGLDPPDNGSAGARLNVLHDDLVIRAQNQSGLRALSFAVCPRRAESIVGDTPCAVFQWSHMGQYNDGQTPIGDTTFEAILYPATGQIVYQYRTALDDLGASGNVGIQNEAVTSGLEYACGVPTIKAKRSVCFFRPGAPALAPATAPALRIETPAIALNNLAPGGGQNVNVTFAVRPDAACGSALQLDYVGTVEPDASSSVRQRLVDTTIGGASCTPTQACPAQVTNINLADGLYFNPKRSGNGEGIFTIPVGAEKTVFSAWFTAEPDRKPIWYIVQDALRDNQVVAPIFRFQQNTGSPTFSVGKTVVGTAQATWLSPTSYAFTWNLDGVPGGQLEQRLYQLAPSTTPNRTGVWYYPLQGGWGEVLDDHFLGAGTEQVAINYIYDSAGAPRWNLGGAGDINQGPISLNQFAVHCPTCPNLTDFFAVRQAAGTVTRTFSGITTGTLSTNITFQPPLLGTWVRDNVPILMISAPQPQNP